MTLIPPAPERVSRKHRPSKTIFKHRSYAVLSTKLRTKKAVINMFGGGPMTKDQIISELKRRVQNERENTIAILKLLREVERQMIYAELAYSSLFDFVHRHLGYSEGAAARRVHAMRALKEIPELESKIESGSLQLTTLAQAQNFFKTHRYSKEEKTRLFAKLENKSSREVEKELLKVDPESAKSDRVRQVSENLVELRITLTQSEANEIQELMNLTSHANPDFSHKELYLKLAGAKLQQMKNPRPVTQPRPRSQATPAPESKAELKRLIHKRDSYQCGYVDPQSGRHCKAKHHLQVDHILPRALGGADSKDNLRVLCWAHNQLHARKTFGEIKKRNYSLKPLGLQTLVITTPQ